MNEILTLIGGIVVGGGSLTALAYGIFKVFGTKWLDAKFAEQLADYKHEQQKEIEGLRFKITSMLDRSSKLHQREFEVLPEAWGLLNDSYWEARAFASPLQWSSDLNRMSAKELDEFIGESVLKEWEKEELLCAKDKNQYWRDHIFWYRKRDCETLARKAHVYTQKHGIFFSPGMRKEFSDIKDMIWDAIFEQEWNQKALNGRGGGGQKFEKEPILRKKGQEALNQLEAHIRERLWDSTKEAL